MSDYSTERYEGSLFFSKLFQGNFPALKIVEHYDFVNALKELSEIKNPIRDCQSQIDAEDFLCYLFSTFMLLDGNLATNFFVESTLDELK